LTGKSAIGSGVGDAQDIAGCHELDWGRLGLYLGPRWGVGKFSKEVFKNTGAVWAGMAVRNQMNTGSGKRGHEQKHREGEHVTKTLQHS